MTGRPKTIVKLSGMQSLGKFARLSNKESNLTLKQHISLSGKSLSPLYISKVESQCSMSHDHLDIESACNTSAQKH